MTLIIKIISPKGIITASDTREVYSKIDETTKERIRFDHKDGIRKSFVKGKFSICVAGNAFIEDKELKDILPLFIEKLDENITIEDIREQLMTLYKNIDNRPSTKYYISYYDTISENSAYKDSFKYEPFLYILDTKKMTFNRINIDNDGFVYGFYWGGENDKINTTLTKRKNIDANSYDIEKSVKLIQEIFKEILDLFNSENEYSSISEVFDLTIQTSQEINFTTNYNE